MSQTSEVQNPGRAPDSDSVEISQPASSEEQPPPSKSPSLEAPEVPTLAAGSAQQPSSPPPGAPPSYSPVTEPPADSSSLQAASKASPRKLTIRTLPPHILVLYSNGGKNAVNAWGRTGIIILGYRKFAEQLFMAYIMHPSSAPPRGGLRKSAAHKAFWAKYRAAERHFVTHVQLLATFAHTSGGADAEGPVRLQHAGWPQMIANVVEIRVEYDAQGGHTKTSQEDARTEGSGDRRL